MPRLIAPLALLAGVWAAWAWNDGAYFGTAFYPGALVIAALLAILAWTTPLRAKIAGPALWALASLVLLAGLTLLSTLWTSAPEFGPEDAQRALAYAGSFVVGIWVCNMLRRRMAWALWPVAAAGAIVALGTALTLTGGDDLQSLFHNDVTLKFPIGYRNANATFFLICLWPALTLASDVIGEWWVRAGLIGASTLMLEVAVLCQSRGSLPAAVLAFLVFIVMSRRGLRGAIYMGLALLPVLPALPALLAVFRHGELDPALVPVLHTAAQAMLLSTVASVVLAAGFFRFVEARVDIGRDGVQRLSRVVALVVAVVAIVGGALLVGKQGGPISFLNQKVDQFQNEGNPNFSTEGVRFGSNVGSNRSDFWRVSLEELSRNPLVGGGAGSFQFTYLQERRSGETPNDPHSVEMLMLAELGLAGLALFACFCFTAARAALRSRSLGPAAISVSAAGMASGTQWLVHASYDWFWHYPAVTGPVMYLLGVAVAPRLLDFSAGRNRRPRRATVAVACVAAISLVPFYLSDKYVDNAVHLAAADPRAATADLRRAAAIEPLAAQPLLIEGVIYERQGNTAEAAAAFRQAIDRQPDNYAGHYLLARAIARESPVAARAEAEEAARLNPRGPEVRALLRRLERGPDAGGGDPG